MTNDFKKGLIVGMSLDSSIVLGVGKDMPPDIFNHGDIVGLNPMYCGNMQKLQASSDYWIISESKIYTSTRYSNAQIMFTAPILRGSYKNLCLDAAVTSGVSGNYNNAHIGYRKATHGAITSPYGGQDKNIALTNYSGKVNYDKSSPWYTLKRQIVKLNLDELGQDEYFFIAISRCDCTPEIYSIWLE